MASQFYATYPPQVPGPTGPTGPQGPAGPAGPNSLIYGTTTISGGATGDLIYDNAGFVGGIPVGSTNQILTIIGGLPTWQTPSSGGTVTSVSVTSANGFAGTVATATTTPAITISTDVSGILFGNGTSVTAAIASNFPTLNQNTTGSAASFTGSLLGDVTGTQTTTALTATSNSTLASLSVLTSATSLNAVGTITTGVWNATAISSTHGGTGITTVTKGDLIIGGAAGSWSDLGVGATGNVLTVVGGTAAWVAPATAGTVTSVAISVPSVLSIVSGSPITSAGTIAIGYSGTALPVANGGTGLTSYTTGQLLYASATGTIAGLSDVAIGQVLTSGGVGVAPVYSATPALTSVSFDTSSTGTTSVALNHYEEWSGTITWLDSSTYSQTAICKIVKIGRLVTAWFAGITGASTGVSVGSDIFATFSNTGNNLPTRFAPTATSQTLYNVISTQNSLGFTATGIGNVTSSSYTIFNSLQGNASQWGTTGSKGFPGFMMHWQIV